MLGFMVVVSWESVKPSGRNLLYRMESGKVKIRMGWVLSAVIRQVVTRAEIGHEWTEVEESRVGRPVGDE